MDIEHLRNLKNEDIALILANISLGYPNFEKALKAVFTVLEGLAVYRPIEFEEIIILWSEHDRRLKTGTVLKNLYVPEQKINPNGQITIGRKQAEDLINEGSDIIAIFGIKPQI